MIYQLPSVNSLLELQKIVILDKEYDFLYIYNDRNDRWYLTINADNVNYLTNQKIMAGVKFGFNHNYLHNVADNTNVKNEFVSSISLYVYSLSNDDLPVNKVTFGKNKVLVFEIVDGAK